jgi:mono/diheme cytochrome c family protein
MRKLLLITTFILSIFLYIDVQAQNNGEELFKSVCAACHTINKGRLVGPDLAGVSQKLEQEWLIRFIRSSQAVIKSGDSAAVAIFNEYNKIPMPDNNFSDEQIISILEYIDAQSSAAPVASETLQTSGDSLAVPDSIGIQYSNEIIEEGRALFYGYKSFANGGSACVACHHINDQSILGGGMLALDLTGSFEKLGPAGIKAIIANPPFPAMKVALLNHKVEEDEITALISLMKTVNEHSNNKPNKNSGGLIFFVFGLIFVLFMLIHIYIFYDNRKIV